MSAAVRLVQSCVRHAAQHNIAFSCRTLTVSRFYSSEAKSRLYTSKHEWVEVNGNIGVVGISHYAQESLGDVVFAQLPDIGTEICQHGWLFKIAMSKPEELKDLMDEAKYTEFLKTAEH